MTNNEEILYIRDLTIKAKKNDDTKNPFRLDEINLDLFKKEILVVVGENGSGKTSLAMALAGLKTFTRGTVFLKNKVILGKPPSISTMNKEINQLLKHCNNLLKTARGVSADFFSSARTLYFKYVRNLRFNPKTGELKPYLNYDYRIKDLNTKKLPFLVSVPGISYVEYNRRRQIEILSTLKDIVKNILRQERFLSRIDKSEEDFPAQMFEAYNDKLQLLKHKVLKIKKNTKAINKVTIDIMSEREKFGQIYENIESAYKSIFARLEQVKARHLESSELMKQVLDLAHQIWALSVLKSKKEKYINYYNKKVNLPRTEVKKSLGNLKKQIENNNLSLTLTQEEMSFLNKETENFWHKKNINFKAISKYLNHLQSHLNEEKQLVPQFLEKQLKRFFNSDFENKIKNFHQEKFAHQNFKNEDILNFVFEKNYIQKVVKKNVVTFRNLIDFWYRINNKSINLSQRAIDEYIELLELLEGPSIDDIVSSSPLYQMPNKKQFYENKKDIQLVFSNQINAMNEKWTIEQILCEGLDAFPELYRNEKARKECLIWKNDPTQNSFYESTSNNNINDNEVKHYLAIKVLTQVGVPPENLSRYPHELSRSQIQKIAFARALIMQPKIIVADEPISALDASLRTQIINLLIDAKETKGISFLILDNDLRSAKQYANRIAVLHDGSIIEIAPTKELIANPVHKYTRKLFEVLPRLVLNYSREKVIAYEKAPNLTYVIDMPIYYEIFENHIVLLNDQEVGEFKEEYIERINRLSTVK